MSAFNELMQKYVNEDYNTLVGLAKSSIDKLLPVCKEVDPDNKGMLMLTAIIISGVAADGVLSAKEKQFLCDILNVKEETVDTLVKLYTGKEEDLVDKLADCGGDDIKFDVVNLVATIAACDETIKHDEAEYIRKLML